MDIKEKNTTIYKLRDEINNLKSELIKSEKQVQTYKDVANTFENENKKLEDKLKRTKERHIKIIKEFENQISDLKVKNNSEKRILEKTNGIITDKAKALDGLLAKELRENRELKSKLEKLEKENEEYKDKIECYKEKNKGGRKKIFTEQQIEEIKKQNKDGKSIRKLAKLFHCSIGTIHSIVKESE
ncbi:MAG: hypothetical protein ACRDBY_05945 [Cetobacterium sp.]